MRLCQFPTWTVCVASSLCTLLTCKCTINFKNRSWCRLRKTTHHQNRRLLYCDKNFCRLASNHSLLKIEFLKPLQTMGCTWTRDSILGSWQPFENRRVASLLWTVVFGDLYLQHHNNYTVSPTYPYVITVRKWELNMEERWAVTK